MTVREGAGLRAKGRIAAILAAVLVCATAAVAIASTTRARVGTQQGKLGTMLAGGNGHTLYLFMRDKSSCYGACAKAWPPDYTHGTPAAITGSGVNSKLLGTTRRKSGALQATYNGHPLYFFSGDSKPGDMHGENANAFGGHWYVVGTSGKAKKPVVFNPGSY